MEKQTSKTDHFPSLNERPRLNFLGHGYLVVHSITRQKGHTPTTPNKQNTRRKDTCHVPSILLILILLSGDVQLNPGPSTTYRSRRRQVGRPRESWARASRGLIGGTGSLLDLSELLAPLAEAASLAGAAARLERRTRGLRADRLEGQAHCWTCPNYQLWSRHWQMGRPREG